MRKVYILFFAVIMSCTNTRKELTAQEIIDKAIVVSNSHTVSNALISFDFRKHSYVADRGNGLFSLERILKTDTTRTKDVLSNTGFKRFVNDELVEVPDSMAIKYSESINSVHYFATLPYGLNDKAVKKKLLEETSIKGKEYYKIQITFHQEGGGVDFEDVFVYWICKKEFEIDYLAYAFHVNGGGLRFREAIKEERIKGIRFVNYNNYKPLDESVTVSTLDVAFLNGQLQLLSEINLSNIKVELKNKS
jgi:hypothetical protein